ncbi:hypothetical protein DPMN_089476 [Dreissena polymorpha]|uniref:Uncharacterized protein n=1 Tax=Dreissena polymorpha TaxID=45954 RepID=A0A9D4KX13_DREPO|nr:hypothetical protein DPMN_089476 [Dreissena polymorpha]
MYSDVLGCSLSLIHLCLAPSKKALANSVDPDETPHDAASHCANLPKAERDQVESSSYSDGQLQISYDDHIFIIYPLHKPVSASYKVNPNDPSWLCRLMFNPLRGHRSRRGMRERDET